MVENEDIKLMFQDINEKVPFFKLLVLNSDCFDVENACIRFPWRDEYAGHPKTLHGGVVSAILDAAGAFVILLHHASNSTYGKKLRGTTTIDLRIDYLLPGKGREFVASGSVLRIGKKVGVIKTELHNNEQQLIAVGTGTYTAG